MLVSAGVIRHENGKDCEMNAHTEESRPGYRALLLLAPHGTFGRGAIFTRLAAELRGLARVVAPDQLVTALIIEDVGPVMRRPEIARPVLDVRGWPRSAATRDELERLILARGVYRAPVTSCRARSLTVAAGGCCSIGTR